MRIIINIEDGLDIALAVSHVASTINLAPEMNPSPIVTFLDGTDVFPTRTKKGTPVFYVQEAKHHAKAPASSNR